MIKYQIDAAQKEDLIHKEIYGHFAEHLGRCIYDGIYVGDQSAIRNQDGLRSDLIEAFRKIKIPVLRWPGGCFADTYHWKDGVGPKALRKKMINTHWGGDDEDNSFGTHEFMLLCEQLGCSAYIAGNVGTGTVTEMQEWVEYMTGEGSSPMCDWRQTNGHPQPWSLPFFGVGNESWGCGGNMRAEYYADLYRHYQTYVNNFGNNKIYKIACGSHDHDLDWTQILMERAAPYFDGLSLHYYTIPGTWDSKGSATDFGEEDWYLTLYKALQMDKIISKHRAVMDRYDPEQRIGMIVDEWGTWYDVEPGTRPEHLYQQNSMRDALVAAVSLNIFNKHAARVRMANLAQTVNVLQALALTENEKMLLTPTYHVFDLFQVHQDSWRVASTLDPVPETGSDQVKIPQVHESASLDKEDRLHTTLCNLSADQEAELDTGLLGGTRQVEAAWILEAGLQATNTFSEPEAVRPALFNGFSMKPLTAGETNLVIHLPAHSIVRLTLSRV